jgi:6,7-dimethyl-8-ribityllumazine synthase
MSTSNPTPPPPPDLTVLAEAHIVIVASRWNADIVDRLLSGTTQRLVDLGIPAGHTELHYVPGAYELPSGALWAASEKRVSAVIALGCVIRGDTPHFDYVAGNCAHGLMQVSLATAKPVIFGVLTVNTHQQALDRSTGADSAHAGIAAANAALEMLTTKARIRDNPSLPQQNFMGIRIR